MSDVFRTSEFWDKHTLGNLLSSVDLCDLLLKQLITLLADVYDLLASYTELGDSFEDLVGNGSGILVLGKSIRVVKRVIYIIISSALALYSCVLYCE